ncbi:LAGLIDADG family homing endonuclease [Bacillus sp. PS06]|uniref:LAGLIDADG family homing endonuclease n=1 Tax=Bacillus sp. PS06 TaxID=2764176 RepID=UPI00178324FE|nr:LAGLIDADG family homing endonuclease [Bacillus sp. PS06]MBD8070418.1 hypothetical protein [Bacillus sp. PS06]
MHDKEEVSYNIRRRGYRAQDKEELINKIVALHKEGQSQVSIAKMLGVNRGTLLRWNKELKFFEPRTPGEAGKLASKIYDYDEDFFKTIETPNKAYILGFILGDGTISLKDGSSKRIIITLAEQDKDLVYDIARVFGLEEIVKFRKKRALNEQNKYSLVINSTVMANDLIKLGVGPNKTGYEKWIELKDKKLQWHFLRGIFDADGHIRVYSRTYTRKTKSAKTYLKARFGITGNLELLEEILLFFKKQGIGENVHSFSQKQGCYDLYISSFKDLCKIYDKMYSDSDLKLQRKFNKFSSLKI